MEAGGDVEGRRGEEEEVQCVVWGFAMCVCVYVRENRALGSSATCRERHFLIYI